MREDTRNSGIPKQLENWKLLPRLAIIPRQLHHDLDTLKVGLG